VCALLNGTKPTTNHKMVVRPKIPLAKDAVGLARGKIAEDSCEVN